MRVTPSNHARALTREIQIVATPSDEGVPLYLRIYRQLREHILSGTLPAGAGLPSARTLAADLGVSRNTVEAAFDQLVAEGFIERHVGAGTVVSRSVAEAAPFANLKAKRGAQRGAAPPAQAPRLSRRGDLLRQLGEREADSAREPPLCMTNIHRFPLRAWNRVLTRQARYADATLLGPAGPLGRPELRQQIAEYATLARGLRCTPDQVLVVGSTQQALDLIARVLLDPGDLALVEEPGYLGARAALLAAGATLVPIPVDDEGLDVAVLPTNRSARLLYLTPSHQFPLGVTMTLARRLALLRWATTQNAWLIEDDYDSEFHYDGRPVAALHALDRAGRVIYLGTYNKVLFPGLRLAYLILPIDLVATFAAARRVVDGFTAPFQQLVLADFIATGQFAAYLRRARQHYARCRDQLIETALVEWGGAVRFGPASTGLHLVAHLPKQTDDVALAQAADPPKAAQPRGLGIAPLSRYYFGPRTAPGLLISYGTSLPRVIETSVRRLAPLFAALRHGKRRR